MNDIVLSRHATLAGPDGRCATCSRELADYGAGLQHRRGRIAGVSPSARKGSTSYPAWKRALLLAEDPDRCECGVLLSEHPPLSKRRLGRSEDWRDDPAKRASGIAAAAGRPCVPHDDGTGHCKGCRRQLQSILGGQLRHAPGSRMPIADLVGAAA